MNQNHSNGWMNGNGWTGGGNNRSSFGSKERRNTNDTNDDECKRPRLRDDRG